VATLPVDDLRSALELQADPARATAMAAYMKGQFEFLGVPTPDRRRAARPFIGCGKGASSSELLDAADGLWCQPEREFQYVAVDLLRKWVRALDADDLIRVEPLIRTRSWWDNVDALATNVVGPLVAAHSELVATMDRWIDDDDIWIARTALLHQLAYGDDTDAARLFGYVDRRSTDPEFFIRKACGWALRQYARSEPDAVREFVRSRRHRLSGLTVREATKHL
jgi:3-methyladenine DNA glycosylase AlkD